MVEKFTPATKAVGSTGGILKKVARSLDTVTESTEIPKIEHRESGDSLPNEKNQGVAEEETAKFRTLCEGVQNQLALFQVSMVELLALKDELLKHALPPSLLVKIALVTSKLFRGTSDLAVPVNELVRLVNLYSAPWESKSAALKKLHEDYENKQRQLNVALQKLVLVGIQADRMSQVRRVLNWERLFTRIMTSKAHGYRWKFLIESFKKKIKTGEIYEAGASTDEDIQKKKRANERQLDHIRRNSMNKQSTTQRIMKEVGTLEGARKSLSISEEKPDSNKAVSSEEEEEGGGGGTLSDIDVSTILDETPATSRQPSAEQHLRKETRISSPLAPTKPNKPKIHFSFKPPSDNEEDDSEEENTKPGGLRFKPTRKPVSKKPGKTGVRFSEGKPRSKPSTQVRGVKFFNSSDDDEEEEKDQTSKQQSTPAETKVLTEDKECWTHEPDYERFLHIRLYKPICKKAEAPCCTVVFMGKALKTSSYNPPKLPDNEEDDKLEEKKSELKVKTSKRSKVSIKSSESTIAVAKESRDQSPDGSSSSIEQIPRFEELLFKLPDTNGYAPGEKPVDISDEQIKFAVHPSHEEPMVAMAAVRYNEIKVLDRFEGRWSHTDFTNEIQKFPLLSTLSDRDMPFGSECGHIPLVCYMSKVESPKTATKETETESFERLVNNEILERRQAEEKEREEAMRGISPPIYTESEIQSMRDLHTEEVQALHSEYERRLNELAQGLDSFDDTEKEFVHVATSPLSVRSPSPARSGSPNKSQSPSRSQTSLHHEPSSQTSPQQVPRPPAEGRSSSSRKTPRPKIPNLPAWGKDLPHNFMVRLDMFNENSEKYRLELEEKTKRAIQQKYELQMAVQNRLSIPDDEEGAQEEVCLPAVFMPTKTGLVFSPKAHSYFHPPGSSESRLTQPPSVFKLPHLDVANQIPVLNLLDSGRRYILNQSHKISPSSPVSQTAPPPPTSHDIDSPHDYHGRACTR